MSQTAELAGLKCPVTDLCPTSDSVGPFSGVVQLDRIFNISINSFGWCVLVEFFLF